jgi:type II secretory pathway component PulF
MSIIGWLIVFLAITGILFTLIHVISLAWLFGVPLLVIFLCLQNYRMKQQGFLWMMAITAERSISMIPAIEAYAWEVGGFYGSRIADFTGLLRSGVPVCDALAEVQFLIPRRLYPIIRTADECGALAKGLREAAAARDAQQDLWGSIAAKSWYIVTMIFSGLFILTFIMLKIVPSFEKIFKDFGTNLPRVTLTLMSCSHWFMNFWYLIAPIFLVFLFLFIYTMLKYFGVHVFDLPGLGYFTRRKHAAAIMDNLAMAVEHDRPLILGIQTLSACYPYGSIRTKLRHALSDIQRGTVWSESLCNRNLIGQSDMAVLQAAERAGNLAWAMREMADSNLRRLAYRANAAVQILFPPVVLCIGAMVLFVVVAMFIPLIALISKLS